jgi:hypothetical protein
MVCALKPGMPNIPRNTPSASRSPCRRRQLPDQEWTDERRDEHAQNGARGRQHQAFHEQLTGEPPARGAKRQPYAQLVTAAASSRFATFTQPISSISATITAMMFGAIDPAPLVGLDLPVEMEPQFLIDLAFNGAA